MNGKSEITEKYLDLYKDNIKDFRCIISFYKFFQRTCS